MGITGNDPHAGHAGHDPHAGHANHSEHAGHANHSEHAEHGDHGASATLGLASAEGGFLFGEVSAPAAPGTPGTLAFTIVGPGGSPVMDFVEEHEKKLHLIVARTDGAHFRHVHPTLAPDGTWTVAWEWPAAGSFRLFADFIPAEAGTGFTLSTVVDVEGDFSPEPATPLAETRTGEYEVAVHGSLVAGQGSELEFSVSRNGEPVTGLEPYLGAFGHLVALRDGDLAYLHAHPHGASPQPGERSGPLIAFEVTAPTPGRYLLFLDFQVAGEVFTAPLVLDTAS